MCELVKLDTYAWEKMDIMIEHLLKAADSAFNKNDLQLAIQNLDKILKIEPEHCAALHLLGLSHYKLGNSEQAFQILKHCLNIHPDFAIGYNSLAVVARGLGEYEDSAEACLKALKLMSNYPEAYYNLGNARFFQGRFHEAELAYLQAISTRPEYGAAFLNLGITYQELGELEDAVDAYQRALEVTPNNSRIHLNFGNTLLIQGQRKQAAEMYMEGLRIAPHDSQLFYHLVHSRKYEYEDSFLENALSYYHQTTSKRDKVSLGFGLGKAYEDFGDYEKSFHFYAQANALKNSELNFNVEQLYAFLGNLQKLFEDIQLKPSQTVSENSVPIFIVGMPRSGTTLIEQILSSHSCVHARGELDNLSKVLQTACEDSKEGFPSAFKHFSYEQLENISHRYMEALCTKGLEFSHYTDKMPQNFLLIGFIKMLFPNARIIHSRRDPLDSCMSCFKHDFSKEHSYSYSLTNLGHYYGFYESVMKFWNAWLGDNQIFEIQYEDLVSNQELYTRDLLNYCGLKFEESCLNFYENKRAILTASMGQVRQPIYKSSVGSWIHYRPWIGELVKMVAGYKIAS